CYRCSTGARGNSQRRYGVEIRGEVVCFRRGIRRGKFPSEAGEMKMNKHVLAAALFAFVATPAAAYTSYLKPEAYWPEGREVEVEGSFASQFFTPQIALPADLAGVNPDGSAALYDQIAVEATATRLEAN